MNHVKSFRFGGLRLLPLLIALSVVFFSFPHSANAALTELTAGQEKFRGGEDLVFRYTGATSESWLGIYLKEDELSKAEPLYREDLDSGEAEGVLIIPSDGNSLYAGEYVAALYRRGNIVSSKLSFSITEKTVYTDYSVYEQGNSGTLFYPVEEEPSENAWVGIYEAGAVPGVDDYRLWSYLKDSIGQPGRLPLTGMTGATPFTQLPIGEYILYYFEDSGYEPTDFATFSITPSTKAQAIFHPADGAVMGSAEGTLTITPEAEKTPPSNYWVFWANDQGVLKEYSPIGSISTSGHNPVVFPMPKNCAAPEGADRLLVRGGTQSKSSGSGSAISVKLPPSSLLLQGEKVYSFSVLSDIHVSEASYYVYNRNFSKMVRDVAKSMPDSSAAIIAGDVSNNGKEREFAILQKLLKQYENTLPQTYLMIGNHDMRLNKADWEKQRDLFLEYTQMPGVYYRFDLNGNAFLCLGSEDAENEKTDTASLSPEQISWFKAQLAEISAQDPQKPIFVFSHQPLQNTVTGSHQSTIVQNDELRQIVDQYPQIVLFSGHTHAALDEETNILQGRGLGPSMVHVGSVSKLWDFEADTAMTGSQGVLVEVYEGYLRIKGRDFQNGEWIGAAQSVVRFGE